MDLHNPALAGGRRYYYCTCGKGTLACSAHLDTQFPTSDLYPCLSRTGAAYTVAAVGVGWEKREREKSSLNAAIADPGLERKNSFNN